MGYWETRGTPGSQVRVRRAYGTTRVLFAKAAGATRGAGHLADLQNPSRSSRVHSGSQTEHCTRSAEGDRGVTSIPVSGGWGHRTDGSISTSRQLMSPAVAPGAALTLV